jgi:hypothetical protein
MRSASRAKEHHYTGKTQAEAEIESVVKHHEL